jgi:hypothetical protein
MTGSSAAASAAQYYVASVMVQIIMAMKVIILSLLPCLVTYGSFILTKGIL